MAAIPFAKFKSLTNINLLILAIRLVQFFFAGMEVGLMGYYIKQELDGGDEASSPFCFMLVVGVMTMIMQFVYCFEFYLEHMFLLDLTVATFWIISFFWMLNYLNPLPCGWGAFNPFGSNHCGQSRAVLIIAIVLSVMWYGTAAMGVFNFFKRKKKTRRAEEGEIV